MSIDRAVALLSSTNEVDNRNGCALVINAAATGTLPFTHSAKYTSCEPSRNTQLKRHQSSHAAVILNQ
jgi:hypothetical protein